MLSLLRIGLLVALVLSVLSTLGVETSSFIAVIGTVGLAVGLALQGSLASFAGGLLIRAFKPFSYKSQKGPHKTQFRLTKRY